MPQRFDHCTHPDQTFCDCDWCRFLSRPVEVTWPEPVSFDDYEAPEFYAPGTPERAVAERIAAARDAGALGDVAEAGSCTVASVTLLGRI